MLFAAEVFKNGLIRRRAIPNVTVATVKEDKNERGAILGYAVTFKIGRSPVVGNTHYGQWLINP